MTMWRAPASTGCHPEASTSASCCAQTVGRQARRAASHHCIEPCHCQVSLTSQRGSSGRLARGWPTNAVSDVCSPPSHQRFPAPGSSRNSSSVASPEPYQQHRRSGMVAVRSTGNGAYPLKEGPAAGDEDEIDIETARIMLEAKLQQPEAPRNLWWAAIKPPMYTVAYVPISVGAALVFYQTGVFGALRFLQLCVASTFIIAWLNTSNDAFDATTGVDGGGAKPESIVNLTGNRLGCLLVAKLFLGAGAALLATAMTAVGDPRVGYLLTAAITCGYAYQGPPFRLSYQGLGEPLCFAAFGPLATTAFYLAQLPAGVAGPAVAVPGVVWGAACVVGATTAAILFCSHFHQIEGDTAAGKHSPLVRMGHQTAAEVLRLSSIAVYGASVALAHARVFPVPVVAALALTLPRCLSLLVYCHSHHWSAPRIRPLKFYAIRWHSAVGAALAGGLVAARLIAQRAAVAAVSAV